MLKLELYGQMQMEKPTGDEPYPDGYVYLPDGITAEDVKQLVSEQLVMIRMRNGRFRREWQQIRDRNERLDLAVYARAIAISLGVDRWTDAHWKKLIEITRDAPDPVKKPVKTVKSSPKPAQRAAPRPQPNWLNRRGR